MVSLLINLLSTLQQAQIEAGLKSVMDTFSDTPITIIKFGQVSLDPFGEDRSDVSREEYSFDAFFEYKPTKVKEDGNLLGETDNNDVKIIVHLNTLETAGLFDVASNKVLINATTDKVRANGEEFEITSVSLDGQINRRQINCIILAKREERNAE